MYVVVVDASILVLRWCYCGLVLVFGWLSVDVMLGLIWFYAGFMLVCFCCMLACVLFGLMLAVCWLYDVLCVFVGFVFGFYVWIMLVLCWC